MHRPESTKVDGSARKAVGVVSEKAAHPAPRRPPPSAPLSLVVTPPQKVPSPPAKSWEIVYHYWWERSKHWDFGPPQRCAQGGESGLRPLQTGEQGDPPQRAGPRANPAALTR